MNIDAELDAWRQQWQSETDVPADLRKKVERQSLLMKLGLVSDILVTIIIGGGSVVWAIRTRQRDAGMVAVATWVFLAIAWTFVMTSSRGTWAPAKVDTAAFVELSIRRCRRSLQAIWFAASLFVIELAFSLGWVYSHLDEPKKPLFAWLLFGSISIDAIWVVTVIFFGVLVWYRRKKKAEFAWLSSLRTEMSGLSTRA